MQTITEEKIKSAVREGVHEAMKTELMKLRALLVPDVSDEEQKDIETRYDTPSRRTTTNYKVNA